MSATLSAPARPTYLPVALLLGLIVTALGVGVIRDFSGPLLDGGDTDQYSYTSYYFARNLSLWPFPHLDLHNNQTLYPYGTHHVFLPWGFERDFFYALLDRWPGAEYAPFLQGYYLYSLVVAAVGTLLLLHRRFGLPKAFVAGLIVSVFTFYNLFKYPAHLNMAVVHWTVLCMLVTFRLLYDLATQHRVSLSFWLLWVWLHVAVLGLELGYVAGYALAFTTLAIPVIGYQLRRIARSQAGRWHTVFTDWLTRSLAAEKWVVAGLLGLLLLTLWLYLPLSLQISLDALGYRFPAGEEMRAWSHPLRLLIPSLPGLDGHSIQYQRYLGDYSYESYAQTSPGLYLTLLALVGLWQQRRQVVVWGPVVGLLLLCLLYHPAVVPTLKIFPWFAFNRHGGRASMVYPTLLCMLALPIHWPARSGARAGLLVLLGLMLAEWYSGYRLRLVIQPQLAPPPLLTFLQTVREAPGRAVLDWPFCLQGADQPLNVNGLCPYYEAQNSINTWRRFHHKAVIGQYVGRLHPDLVRPLLRDGWPRLLTPGYRFTPADWTRLDRFLRTQSFAGIILYPDLLTRAQTQDFLARYGPATAQTTHPTAGTLLFLPVRPGH